MNSPDIILYLKIASSLPLLFILLRLGAQVGLGLSSITRRQFLGLLWIGWLLGFGALSFVQARWTFHLWTILSHDPVEELARLTSERRMGWSGIEYEAFINHKTKVTRSVWLPRNALLQFLGHRDEEGLFRGNLVIPVVHASKDYRHLIVGKIARYDLEGELNRFGICTLLVLLLGSIELVSSKYIRQALLLMRYCYLGLRLYRSWMRFSILRRLLPNQRKQLIVDLVFTALSSMGRTGGTLRASERQAILEITDRFSLLLSTKEKVFAVRAARQSHAHKQTLHEALTFLIKEARLPRSLRAGVYEMLLYVAQADSIVNAEERVQLITAAGILGIGEKKARRIEADIERLLQYEARLVEYGMPTNDAEEYDWQDRVNWSAESREEGSHSQSGFGRGTFQGRLSGNVQSKNTEWEPYVILGLRSDATMAAIKSAYRRLALKYHPDRSSYSGVSKENASDRFRQVQEAYERIVESRLE